MTLLARVVAFFAIATMSFVSHAQQQPSIAGLTMNMSLAEAKAKLSGFSITPLRVSGYLPDLQVFAAIGDGEAFIVGAMDDKVAYIYRQITLSPEKAVDEVAYRKQLVVKYGKPSYQNDTWHWDGAGHLASGDWNSLNCSIQPRGIGVGPVPHFQPYDRNWMWPKIPFGVFAVPPHDVAGCHTILSVTLVQSGSQVSPNAVNFMAFEMSDPSLYFPAVSREIAKQKAAADAKQKATERNSGPPL